jgi:hypothetical protein
VTPQLEQKITEVLGRLDLLSEAPGSRPLSDLAPPEDLPKSSEGNSDRRVNPKRHHESSVPGGASLRRRGAPSKERSLSDWWRWRFAKAIAAEDSDFELYRLCLLAERDWAKRVFHSPDRMALRSGALTENDAVDGGRAEQIAGERVVDLYEGVPAVEVAVHEEQTEEWVKKARRQLGRNPEDGRPRSTFLDLGEEDRGRKVASLANRGMSQQKVADRLGVGKTTVQRYWPAQSLAA